MAVTAALTESSSPEPMSLHYYEIVHHLFSGSDRGIQAPGSIDTNSTHHMKRGKLTSQSKQCSSESKSQQMLRTLFLPSMSLMATTTASSVQTQLTSVFHITIYTIHSYI